MFIKEENEMNKIHLSAAAVVVVRALTKLKL